MWFCCVTVNARDIFTLSAWICFFFRLSWWGGDGKVQHCMVAEKGTACWGYRWAMFYRQDGFRARAEVAILTSCIWAEMEPYHNVAYSIYNSWQCIFFKGLLPTELCFAILCKCQQIPSKGLLARELLGLWGFDMVEEVASVIAHRDALVAEFEVKIWSFYLHK